MVSIRGCNSSNLPQHQRQLGKLSTRPKSLPCCTRRVIWSSHISTIRLHIPPTLNWLCETNIMNLLGTALSMPVKYTKSGFWVSSISYTNSQRPWPCHHTHFLHQAHEQLNQAAQLSLKTSVYLTLKITPACSALHWFISNTAGYGAIQNTLQTFKTTQSLTILLETEVHIMLLKANQLAFLFQCQTPHNEQLSASERQSGLTK